MSADVDLVRGPFGEQTIAVEVRNRVTYTPFVFTLPPALDRYFQRKAYPRWTRTLQDGIDDEIRGGWVAMVFAPLRNLGCNRRAWSI